MAYSQRFLRLTALYAISGTDERAQFDLTVSGPLTAAGGLPTQGHADTFRDLVDAFNDDTANVRAAYARAQGVKIAALDVNGHYVGDPVIAGTPFTGAGAANVVAPQLSICVSLLSAQSLGKGNKGRFYIPYSGPLPAGQAYMDGGSQNLVLNAAKDLIDGVNGIFGPDESVRIMSQAGVGGSAKEVVSLRVGRVVDTQRRRRRSLTEQYVSIAL